MPRDGSAVAFVEKRFNLGVNFVGVFVEAFVNYDTQFRVLNHVQVGILEYILFVRGSANRYNLGTFGWIEFDDVLDVTFGGSNTGRIWQLFPDDFRSLVGKLGALGIFVEHRES